MVDKKTIGVKICGWYFLALGIINLGHYQKIGIFAYILATICFCTGIGILKLFKLARIVALVVPFISTLFYFYFVLLLLKEYSFDVLSERMIIGEAISKFIINLIIFVILLIFLNRTKVKKLFDN